MNRVYGMEKLEQLLRDERFLQELAWERHLSEFYYAFRARALGERFGIKSWLYPVIAELIETGDFKPELALEPVSIEVDRTSSRGLKLLLAEDISQAELRRYVTEHWKKDIEPELHGLAKGRETVSLIPERDERVYADYINRKKRNLTIVAIAMRNNVSVRTVNRIVRDKKKSL